MYHQPPVRMVRGYRPYFQPPFQRNPNFVPRGPFHHPRMPVQDGENYWCETCDRGFPTPEVLEKHKQQHQKCNIDGCQFIAHPKVITKHIQMQHSTGLYKKIANLNNPEDIQRWREDRKKKYPTKENVEKKAAELKEKIERGEKMGLKHDKNRNRKPGDNQKRKYPFGNNNADKKKKPCLDSNKPISHKKNPPKKQNALPNFEHNRKLKPFSGISDMIIEETDDSAKEEQIEYDIEDDEYLNEEKGITDTFKSEEPIVCGALSTLISEYGVSDEETDTVSSDTHSLAIESTTPLPNKIVIAHSQVVYEQVKEKKDETKVIVSDDESGPEEIKVEKPKETQIDTQKDVEEKSKKKPKIMSNHKIIAKKPKPKLPSTLLRKLLAKEIQQERNIVLQCIRHIINLNFFEK